MSAPSSARSKRRQTLLLSSQRRSSLLPLPLPQLDDLAFTSTPRGPVRPLFAPLPTPQASTSKAALAATPSVYGDHEQTLFAPVNGLEADETALLSVDFRSTALFDEREDDLFDTTAVLQQKAFAQQKQLHDVAAASQDARSTSNGLGALIFSNLLASGDTQQALDNLELGKRQNGESSRSASFSHSPVKRNASFVVDSKGQSFVEYETDVRFGDDLLVHQEDSYEVEPLVHSPAAPRVQMSSQVLGAQHQATRPLVIFSKRATFTECQDTDTTRGSESWKAAPFEDSCTYAALSDPAEGRASVRIGHRHGSAASPNQSPETMWNTGTGGDRDQAASGSTSPRSRSPSIRSVEEESPVITEAAGPSSPLSTSNETELQPKGNVGGSSQPPLPSPNSQAQRQVRRVRRGLTSSMAFQLSPVAEEQERERSVSYLSTAQSGLDTSVRGSQVQNVEQLSSHQQLERSLREMLDTEPAASQFVVDEGPLSFSLAQRPLPPTQEADVHILSPACVVEDPLSCAEQTPTEQLQQPPPIQALAQDVVGHLAADSLEPDRANPQPVAPERPAPAVPRYLKPTLSTSAQQRKALEAKKQTTKMRTAKQSQQRAFSDRATTAPPQAKRESQNPANVPIVARKEGSVWARSRPPSGYVAPSHTSVEARLARQKSIDDLFERRQRDGARKQAAAVAPETSIRRHENPPTNARQTTNPQKAEILTLPKSFAFAEPRKPRNDDTNVGRKGRLAESTAPTRPRAHRPVHTSEAAHTRPASRVDKTTTQKPYLEDAETGPNISLTEASLRVQNAQYEEASLSTEGGGQCSTKDAARILQRYLKELNSMNVEEESALDAANPLMGPSDDASHHQAVARADDPQNEEHSLPPTPPPKKRRIDKVESTRAAAAANRPTEKRRPLAAVSRQVLDSRSNIRPTQETTTAAVKPPGFTFSSLGREQLSFADRLAAWQEREKEAARTGKPMLRPIVSNAEQRAKPKTAVPAPRKRAIQPQEFVWESDRRAKERKDWEERLKEKESIMAELEEIRRLEAEAAEAEEMKRMRAAQIPKAHRVPAALRSKKRVRA